MKYLIFVFIIISTLFVNPGIINAQTNAPNSIFLSQNYDIAKSYQKEHNLRTDDSTLWTVYTSRNSGLVNDFVLAIAIDSTNRKWFGTSNAGVSVYDDENWLAFDTLNSGIASNRVSSIVIDNNGTKWFGFIDNFTLGVSSFDGKSWQSYGPSNSGLSSPFVTSIAVDHNNNKWFGTMVGRIFVFDGLNWITYNPSECGLGWGSFLAILVDHNGDIWAGSSNLYYGMDSGVSVFNGTTWTRYDTSNSGLPSNSIEALALDQSGNIWFGTTHGVTVYDGSNWITYDTMNSDLSDNYIISIGIDSNNVKWFGTYDKGLVRFDGLNWKTFDTSNSKLPGNMVNSISVDKTGNLWIGTDKGVVRLSFIVAYVNERSAQKFSKTNRLFQNYPNPFNSQTVIKYNLGEICNIKGSVFDLTGKEVITLVSDKQNKGRHQVVWNGRNAYGEKVSSGIYFFKLQTQTLNVCRKMVFIR